MSGSKKEVYVAFSGGGAKAVIHVGALSYVERSYKISGVSGTSAGAAIAALKAAGFTAKDIFNPHTSLQGGVKGESKLFERIKKRNKDVVYLSDLLGGGGFSSLKSAQRNFLTFAIFNMGRYNILALVLAFFLVCALPYTINKIFSEKIPILLSSSLSSFALIFSLYFLISWWLVPAVLRSVNSTLSKGIATTDRAVREICQEIAIKLNIHGRPVRMADFPIPLYIVATNISGRRAVVYSKAETPDVTLYDALSASICIPIAFPVHEVNGIRHLDGGIVSNLPAFVFSDELSLFPHRKVIALRIVEEGISNNIQGQTRRRRIIERCLAELPETVSLGTDLISTLLTGTQDLAHDRMNIVQTTLPTPLKVLDFNLSLEDAATAFRQGELSAKRLILKSFISEDIYNAACKNIADEVKAFLNKLNLTVRKSGDLVRVAMAFRSSEGSPVLTLSYSYGFNGKSDWNMPIPFEGSVCGEAWRSKSVLLNMNSRKIISSLTGYPHIMSRIDKDIQWILSVPIVRADTENVAFVINIDSNAKLKDYATKSPAAHDEVLQTLTEIARIASLIGHATLESIDEFKEE